MPNAKKNDDRQMRLNHSWEWFKYHAAQRQQSFYHYLVIIGAILTAWGVVLEKADGQKLLSEYKWILMVIGIFISFVFLVLDVRNEKLINAGKDELQNIQREIDLKIIPDCKPCLLSRHRFWLKAIYICNILLFVYLIYIGR